MQLVFYDGLSMIAEDYQPGILKHYHAHSTNNDTSTYFPFTKPSNPLRYTRQTARFIQFEFLPAIMHTLLRSINVRFYGRAALDRPSIPG